MPFPGYGPSPGDHALQMVMAAERMHADYEATVDTLGEGIGFESDRKTRSGIKDAGPSERSLIDGSPEANAETDRRRANLLYCASSPKTGGRST